MVYPLTGNLLVASSLVTNPFYASGVCLVVHQDDDDLIGVMLNRPLKPTPETVRMMLGEASRVKSEADSTSGLTKPASGIDADSIPGSPWNMLHFGGPLSGPVVAVHSISQYGDVETGQGIYLAAQKHLLEHLVQERNSPCRLIVGHLGWESDQLQSEMDQGYWHILPATAENVFLPAQEMWPRIIRQATTVSLARWTGIQNFPDAADLN